MDKGPTFQRGGARGAGCAAPLAAMEPSVEANDSRCCSSQRRAPPPVLPERPKPMYRMSKKGWRLWIPAPARHPRGAPQLLLKRCPQPEKLRAKKRRLHFHGAGCCLRMISFTLRSLAMAIAGFASFVGRRWKNSQRTCRSGQNRGDASRAALSILSVLIHHQARCRNISADHTQEKHGGTPRASRTRSTCKCR